MRPLLIGLLILLFPRGTSSLALGFKTEEDAGAHGPIGGTRGAEGKVLVFDVATRAPTKEQADIDAAG